MRGRPTPPCPCLCVEALHAVLAAASYLAGDHVPRHDETGYDHEPTLATAALMTA